MPASATAQSIAYICAQLKRADERIVQLEDQLELSEERVIQLEKMLNAPKNHQLEYTVALGLTGVESQVLGILMERQSASTDQIEACLYGHRPEPVCNKIIAVYIHKLRKKLNPRGVAIGLVWGQGYLIAPPMKERIRQLVLEWHNAGAPTRDGYRRKSQEHIHV